MAQLGFSFEVGSTRRKKPAGGRVPRVSTPATAVQMSLLQPAAEAITTPQVPVATIGGTAVLEAALRARLGPFVMVKLTNNTSTMISFRKKGRVLYIRAHAMFAHACDEVVDALAAFVTKDALSAVQSARLDGFIEAHRAALSRKRQAARIQPQGEVHNLAEIFDELNAHYFDNRISARITWSVAQAKMRRASIKMGSYADGEKLIRIHPALDQAFVPKYFVAFVVYHEMLHQIHRVGDGCGRRVVHPPAFRNDERRYEAYRRSVRWERQNLARLLRY